MQRGIEQLGITTLCGLMGNETNTTRPERLKVKVKNESYWGDVGAQPDRCQRSRLCWESRKGGVADRSRGRAGCSTSLGSPAYGEWTKSWLFTPGCVTSESYTISLCLSFLFCETVVIIVARRIVVSIQSVKKHNTLRMTSKCSTNVGTPSSPGDLCGPSGSGLQAFVMAS